MTRHWDDIEQLALDLTDDALSDLIDALQAELTARRRTPAGMRRRPGVNDGCGRATCRDCYMPDDDSGSAPE